MKKSIIIVALACAMVFAFAGTAMADHSPQFYFNFQPGAGVTSSPAFMNVFPEHEFNVEFTIDNGTEVHSGYAQTTAKCGVCHSVHRAPVYGTATAGTSPTTSSRYQLNPYETANADTQLLLRSTAAGACDFCHVTSGQKLMYGGDATKAWVSSADTAYSWNEFYGHTTGCPSCHSTHGASTLPGSKNLKYDGVKASSGFNLRVQDEIFGGPLWATKADMIAGVLKPSALADGVNLRDASITANCSTCHYNYSPDNNTMINDDLDSVALFQSGAWSKPNGSLFVYNTATQVPSAALGAGAWGNTFVMKYHNHPMKNADVLFTSPGAGGLATDGSVANFDSYNCVSCHTAPRSTVMDGAYIVQSFPHYTPGYYKFMGALDQGAFQTPATKADVDLGRAGYYNQPKWMATLGHLGRPAVMNDGYCLKCHSAIGTSF